MMTEGHFLKAADLKKNIKEKLEEAGIQDADAEVRLLLKAYAGITEADIYADPDILIPSEEALISINEALDKRCRHIPLQHILGKTCFMGFDFNTPPGALIPRPDTEILVEEVLRDYHEGCKILDLCTGTGCIIISLMALTGDCIGTGTDISEDALAIARENAHLILGDKKKLPDFRKGDLYEALDDGILYDIIVSNPPYIKSGDIENLMPEVKDYDPLIALDGGSDGLDFYKRIISGARAHMIKGGEIFLEIGFDQASDVTGLLEANGFKYTKVIKDYSGNDRVVRAVSPVL